MVLSGDGWTKGPIFECGRCRQGVQRSEGSGVLNLVSFCQDLVHREDAEVFFLVCVSQAGMRLPVWYVRSGNSAQQV